MREAADRNWERPDLRGDHELERFDGDLGLVPQGGEGFFVDGGADSRQFERVSWINLRLLLHLV